MARFNLSQIQSLLRQTGWPENLIAKFAAIVIYESSGNSNAHNPNGEDSWGLLQINWPYHREYDRSRLIEPVYNLTAAYAIYRREGVRAWYNSNLKYERNLNGVAAQSQAIYNGNNVEPMVIQNAQQIYNAATNNPQPLTGSTFGEGGVIVLLVGLGALLIIGQR